MRVQSLISTSLIIIALSVSPTGVAVAAPELLQVIDSKDYAPLIRDAGGLTIADDGVIYVTSEDGGTLLKVKGDQIDVISLVPEIFRDPDLGGVDLTADGRLVVINRGSGQVAVIGEDLQMDSLFSESGDDAGELRDPRAVAVSVNDTIYVGDRKNKQISVFNQQGLFLHSFGKHGSGGQDLLRPTHVSIDADENVYVLEGPDRLSIFGRHGDLVARFESSELVDILGDRPEMSALTTDHDGNIYIGNYVDNRISIIDWRQRKAITAFGSLGQGPAQYLDITYLSVNSLGQLAVLDKKNAKVEVFQLEITSSTLPTVRDLLVHGVTIEADCEALYAFVEGKSLCKKPKGQGIFILGADGSEQAQFAASVKKPGAMHVGENSVAILEKNKLHAFSHAGDNLFTIGRYGTSGGGFKDPGDVFIQGGLYYVSDTGNNRVQIFSGQGQYLGEVKAGQGDDRLFTEVGPIAVDSAKNIYLADGSELGFLIADNMNQQ